MFEYSMLIFNIHQKAVNPKKRTENKKYLILTVYFILCLYKFSVKKPIATVNKERSSECNVFMKREKLDIGRIRIPWSMFHGPSFMGYFETKEEQKRLKLKIVFSTFPFLHSPYLSFIRNHSDSPNAVKWWRFRSHFSLFKSCTKIKAKRSQEIPRISNI